MRLRVHVSILMLVAAVASIAYGCGDDDDGEPAAVVQVELSEWRVVAQPASVSAGRIRFQAQNTGNVDHELVIIQTDAAPDKLPVSDGKVDEAKAGKEIGEIEEFDPGKAKSGTFSLNPGRYVLLCNIAGHYELGMRAGFEVR